MANTPQGAYTPSDDELDELVSAAEGDEGNAPEPVDGPEPIADDEPSSEGQEPGSETTAEAEEGAETDAEAEPTETSDEDGAPALTDAPAASSQPFKIKGAGQEHVMPGITEMKDGSLRATKEAAAQLRQTLASAIGIQHQWKEERRGLQRELREARESKSDKEIEAETIVSLFGDLREMTPEERWAWANKFAEEAPKLEIAIDKKKLERDREALKREREGGNLLPEEQQERVQEALGTELRETFTRLMQRPEAKLLTPEDKRTLWQKYAADPARLVRQATEDMPEQGIKKGDTIIDDGDVAYDFNYLVSIRQRSQATTTAGQRNAALNADRQRTNAIPPTPRARTPQGAPNGQIKKPKSRKDFEKQFMAGKLDKQE